MTLSGSSITRIDPQVNFNWGTGSPDPAIPADGFSARWTGQLLAAKSEPYTIYATSDDGIRVWVGGVLVDEINGWMDQATDGVQRHRLHLRVAGQLYDLRVEYYEDLEGATVVLSWSSPTTTKQVIPASPASSTRFGTL